MLMEPELTWHANHTMHHKLPFKTTAYGNAISVLFFFYGYSMENLSAINLYGQSMTLMLLCMVIQWFSCFSWNFFRRTTFNFLFKTFLVILCVTWKNTEIGIKIYSSKPKAQILMSPKPLEFSKIVLTIFLEFYLV